MREEKQHHAHPQNIARARGMRVEQTPAEATLWNRLRGQQTGYKFRRQQPLGPYIVDFYCSSCQLIVEVDGDTHTEQADYDIERTAWLQTEGHKVIRFTNNEVQYELNMVLETILAECQNRPSNPQHRTHAYNER